MIASDSMQAECEMERDMDLVRDLLKQIEADPECNAFGFKRIRVEGRSEEEVDYHLGLLDQAGYIRALIPPAMQRHYEVSSLTWNGHEFLDNIKDEGIWSQTKERIKEMPGVALTVAAEIATNLIRSHFKLP